MITNFVRDNVAYIKCTECGAESPILKYVFSHVYDFPVISNEKTVEDFHAFSTLHRLCKKPVDQQLSILDGH